jgi:hypothetical protein
MQSPDGTAFHRLFAATDEFVVYIESTSGKTVCADG